MADVKARGRRLVPTLTELVFVALVGWLFVFGHGWSALLADGDTGWHIRAGELILDSGLPQKDPFSFTKPDERWYAWEWLSEVIFAGLHRAGGLKAVVLFSGLAIALGLALAFRSAMQREANALLALLLILLTAGASGIHYLARPHIFTLLLLPLAMSLAERRDRWRWLLVPLTALWTNLHGGFVALPVSLTVLAAGEWAGWWLNSRREVKAGGNPGVGTSADAAPTGVSAPQVGPARLAKIPAAGGRTGLLAASCALASLLNPYGWELHRHIASYLRSDWIRQAVDEFQAPKFRSEAAFQFELLLFAAVLTAGSLLRRRSFGEAALLLFWAHAALVSARHIPVFALLAAPVIAAEASRLWRGANLSRGSALGILRQIGEDLRGGPGLRPAGRFSLIVPAALALALAFAGPPMRWPETFPEEKFPVALIERQAARLDGQRVFTSDEWADYLLYRFHPRQRVFIDGRSDFYGPEIGRLYVRTVNAHPDWPATLERYQVRRVLAEPGWPLAWALERAPGWRLVDREPRALLFVRD